MLGQRYMGGSGTRIGGGFTALFSLIMGLLILFALPSACSFLSGLELLILGFLFIVGIVVFFFGGTLSRKLLRK